MTSPNQLQRLRATHLAKILLQLQENDPALQKLQYYCPSLIFSSELGRCLTNNTHLRWLMLRLLTLHEDSARNLAEGIRQSKLEGLVIFPDVLKQESTWKILCNGIQSSSTLQQLKFLNYGEMPSEILGNLLTALKTLQTLSFHNFDGDELFQILGENLERSSSLTKLAFLNGRFSEIAIMRLGRGLRQNTSLKILEFESCRFNHAHVTALVEQWHPDSQIEELCLVYNHICARGAQVLISAMAPGRMPVRKLDLSYNKDIGYEGLQLIGEALPTLTSLTSLSTAKCSSYEHAMKDARDKASRATLNGLKQALHLKYFDTSYNFVDLLIEDELYFYGCLIQCGRYMLSSEHELASTVWCHVLEKCQRSNSLVLPVSATPQTTIASVIFYILSEQPSLRHLGR